MTRLTNRLCQLNDSCLTIAGAQTDRMDCSSSQARRTDHETWTLHSVCALGSATVTTDAEVIGELGRQYWVRGQSDTTGAAQPVQDGRHAFTAQGKRLGACPKGQRGGDVITESQVVDIFTAAPRNN